MQLINATMGCGRVGVVGTKGWAIAIAEPQTDSHWWLWFGTPKSGCHRKAELARGSNGTMMESGQSRWISFPSDVELPMPPMKSIGRCSLR